MITVEKLQTLNTTLWTDLKKDSSLKNEMRKNPVAVMNKYLDEPLPKNFTIKVVDADPSCSQTLVLLPMQRDLSDEDLDAVAGGGFFSFLTDVLWDIGKVVVKRIKNG